jgi:threonine synthase
LPENIRDFAICVPSGNFGNLTAGIIAGKMGLPVRKFIAGNNSNHPVTDYLETGIFRPHPALRTMSNAMDVGNPSNFPRILEIYGRDHKKITDDIRGYWFDDRLTTLGLKELLDKYNYQADPHGAVAYLAMKKYRQESNAAGIFLETAHPGKFSAEVESATGKKVAIPEQLRKLLSLDKESVRISGNYSDLKDILTSL